MLVADGEEEHPLTQTKLRSTPVTYERQALSYKAAATETMWTMDLSGAQNQDVSPLFKRDIYRYAYVTHVPGWCWR